MEAIKAEVEVEEREAMRRMIQSHPSSHRPTSLLLEAKRLVL